MDSVLLVLLEIMDMAVNQKELLLLRLLLAERKQCLSRCFHKRTDQHRIWN